MGSTLDPHSSSKETTWVGSDVIELEERPPLRFFQWWYSWSTIPEPSTPASFVKREAWRRSRLVSIISFILIVALIIFLYGSFTAPNPLMGPLNLALIAISFIALFFNHYGKTILAGTMLVVASEAVLTFLIFTTTPFYELAIGLYCLYVVTEFLAVSLLPTGFVFLIATINSLFIWLSLTYENKTTVMIKDLHSQYMGVLLLQIGLQIIVAGIAFIWVHSMIKALKRADRAEMVAKLEHRFAEQSSKAEQERLQLELSIQQLVTAHIDATKSQLVTKKIPYPPAKVLWPLVGVINTLWLRLQRTNQIEHDLQKLEQAITAYTEVLHTVQQFSEQLPAYRTKTALDPLIAAVGQLYNTARSHKK